MATITINFRAKKETFTGGTGYKVPDIKPHHVSVNGKFGMVEDDIRMGRMNALHWLLRKKFNGYKLPGVIWDEPSSIGTHTADQDNQEMSQWDIRPIGNGFMADVSRTFTFNTDILR